jgi:hypothetical protein
MAERISLNEYYEIEDKYNEEQELQQKKLKGRL